MTTRLAGIDLPDDLQWTDEFTGHGVGQQITPTITGALVVEETTQSKGRPITLAGNGHAWVPRATVEALAALAATPVADGATLLLEWTDGRTFDVVFDRSRGPGFSAREVRRLSAGIQGGDHPYIIELTLLTA